MTQAINSSFQNNNLFSDDIDPKSDRPQRKPGELPQVTDRRGTDEIAELREKLQRCRSENDELKSVTLTQAQELTELKEVIVTLVKDGKRAMPAMPDMCTFVGRFTGFGESGVHTGFGMERNNGARSSYRGRGRGMNNAQNLRQRQKQTKGHGQSLYGYRGE